MAKIKFCENNFSQGIEELRDRIENEIEDVSVKVEPCLGYCGDCAEGPFALVNNEFVQADNIDELYDEIINVLE